MNTSFTLIEIEMVVESFIKVYALSLIKLVSRMLKKACQQLKDDDIAFSVLDDVIDTLRFRGSIFFHSSLAAPWGMLLPALPLPRFHIALEGAFYIGADDDEVSVKPMDIIMLPNGGMHWIADDVNRELVPSERASEACELDRPLFQQGDITNRVMCGVVEYEYAISHPIISALPSICQLSNIQHNDSIWITVRQIDTEIARSQSKKSAIIDRLTEVLFIQLLNQFVSENNFLSGFLAALHDPGVNRVLQLIHKSPEKHWSLDSLGKEVGMSRATLQRKFKAALDASPIAYLSHWRLTKAYQLVKHSNLTFDAIADKIGLSDARTLRTAFQRRYGITPNELRKAE
jgi:AraC-like DNA-binding protein